MQLSLTARVFASMAAFERRILTLREAVGLTVGTCGPLPIGTTNGGAFGSARVSRCKRMFEMVSSDSISIQRITPTTLFRRHSIDENCYLRCRCLRQCRTGRARSLQRPIKTKTNVVRANEARKQQFFFLPVLSLSPSAFIQLVFTMVSLRLRSSQRHTLVSVDNPTDDLCCPVRIRLNKYMHSVTVTERKIPMQQGIMLESIFIHMRARQ